MASNDFEKRVIEDLAIVKTQLSEHMRRTDAVEKLHAHLTARVVPLERSAAMFSGLLKALSLAAALAGAVAAIVKLLG